MESKKSILLFQRIIPSYRVPIFKRLYNELGVLVCYSNAFKRSSLSSTEKLDFPSEKLKGFFYARTSTAMVQNPLPLLLKYRPEIVIAEGAPSYLTLWLLFFFRLFFKYKLILWSHGVKYKEFDVPFKGIYGKIRLILFNLADAVILYSGQRKDILSKYVKNPQKLFVAWNTMDTSTLLKIQKQLSLIGKEKIKKEINWDSKFNVVFVGRLLKSKRLDILADAFNLISNKMDISLHIFGDGPEFEFVKRKSKENQRIHVYGSLFDDIILGKYIYSGDFMVMAGYVGLSIIHAFAFGCPVITCEGSTINGPHHSPEIEYLINNYNGYILKSDPSLIAFQIEKSLNSPKLLEDLSSNALKTVEERASLSNMLEGFTNAIEYTKQLHRN